MSDKARLARLTELARRVWPGEVADNIPAVQQEPGHWVEVYGRRVSVLMSVRSSSRALDALEAALLVLAGDLELSGEERSLMRPDIQRIVEANVDLGMRYTQLLVDLEQLASEWRQRETELGSYVRDPVVSQKGQTYGTCARELRERAKGEPCE